MKVQCPYCGQEMMATTATVQCPKCAQTLVVQQPPIPLQTPPPLQMGLQPPPKPGPPAMQLPSRSSSSVRSPNRGNKTTLPILLAVGGGGFLLGSEKSAKERIEVKYNRYAYYQNRDEEGKSNFHFNRGQSKTVDSVGKTMRGLD